MSAASEDVLGEAAGAYGTFLEAWADEFSLNADALDEIGTKFGAAADAYTQHEVYWSQKFRAFIPPNQ
ncbi:hypothetical protein ACFXHA_22230 [Nocardia sp. NPDC059240]|uniref:hypothetical protein n=1 Tax=Nocardia sp. NPDC059240 TaxID=3346786 RepID=UPI00367CD7AD